jgi:putative nucleotidyltransferase with HDIG domain
MMSNELQTQARIKIILAGVEDLKPLSATVTQALKVMDMPEVEINKIASIISVDQALTARILKLANSAYYGFIYPASTLQEAITRLGLRQTKSVLYTASFSGLLGRKIAGYNLRRGDLWKHSIAVAMIAQRLAERVVYAAPEEAYIGGLLHDLGKLVLDQYLNVDWGELLVVGQSHELPLIEAEEYLLGLNHAQVGGELARKWRFPDCLVDAIAHHHSPTFAQNSGELAAIVHLADTICLRMNIGLCHPTFLPKPSPAAMRLLFIDDQELDLLTGLYKELLGVSLVGQEV